jgi:hypothetical protein
VNPSLEEIVFSRYPNETRAEGVGGYWNSQSANYLAGDNATGDSNVVQQSQPVFSFDIEYAAPGAGAGLGNLTGVRCVTFVTLYEVTVTYIKNVQTIVAKLKRQTPLDAGVLLQTELFYNVTQISDPTLIVQDNFTLANNTTLQTVYSQSNIRAVKDGLVGALSGAISELGQSSINSLSYRIHRPSKFWIRCIYGHVAANTSTGRENQMVSNTIILGSPFAVRDRHMMKTDYYVSLDLSGPILEELMQNVMLSMLSLNQTTTNANVTMTTYRDAYELKNQLLLIGPYASTLAVGLAIMIAGFTALIKNGVSASGGPFLQVLCTTTGGEKETDLNRLAAQGSLGGDENMPKELKRLKVRFGILKHVKGDNGLAVAGFGTVQDTIPLQRT